ncbi:hypothetical protein [Nonomuraea rubra]|uniref:hypothetical protein n=1 Tax=Nonomuraea rubra TaxID=46180 RepID=UPI0031E5AC2D
MFATGLLRAAAGRAGAQRRAPSELGHGGHFAALETPEVLVTELREFFGSLR